MMAAKQNFQNLPRLSLRDSTLFAVIIGFLTFLLTANDLVECSLRNVSLIIEPPAVRRGQHAILRCLYDMDGKPLYSAKFYRGHREFYRYTPGEHPNTKVFPFPGIHVDVTSSNATQVLIRNVGFELSGNYSCEVSADKPPFSTATAVGIMQVVEYPEKLPQLFAEHTRYEPGDILRANCSSLPSRPRAELKFTLNNMVIHNVDTQYIPTIDHLIASRISMTLQLQGIHFSSISPQLMHGGMYGTYGGSQMPNSYHLSNSIGGGSLILRCTSTIGDFYQEYKEIELGIPQKDPVPARVTHSSGSGVKNFFSSYFSSHSKPQSPTKEHLIFILLLSAFSLSRNLESLFRMNSQIVTALSFTVAQQIAELLHSAAAHAQHLPDLSRR